MEHGQQQQQEQEQEERSQEPWFWLAAELGSSCSWDTKLGLSCARRDLSELPTLEEGLLSSAEASGAAAPASPLDVQESRFSPCLPLLLSPAQAETFLQGSQMDFLPLRGVPDVSGASLERSEPAHVRGSASLRGPALPSPRQHSQPVAQEDPGAAPQSGEPLGSQGDSGDSGTEQEAPAPRGGGDPAQPAPEEGLGKGLGQPWSTAGKDGQPCGHSCGHSSQDSDGPAAGSELSQGNKESPGQEESSSSSGNSYTTALTKFSEKSERGVQQEKVKVAGSGAGVLEKLEKGKKVPEAGLSDNSSDVLRKGHAKTSGARDVLCAAAPGAGRGRLQEPGGQPRGSQGLGLSAALLGRQQEQPAAGLGTEGLVPAGTPGQPQEPAGSRDELTASDCSIQRGHKATEISPSFCLGDEGSFSLLLPHPDFQSTPGLFLRRAGKAEGPGGGLVMLSDLRASPSCSSEEAPGTSPDPGEQPPPQSAVEETCGRLESLRLESPCPGRIQSFPSLGFLEKVGAWDLGQPQQGPAATSSRVPGASPRKASSAPAGPAGCVSAAQRSPGEPRDGAAAACRGTGSLGSLHFPPTHLLPAPPLSRSQSDSTVNASSRSRALPAASPAARGELSPALGGSDTDTSTPRKVLPPSPAEGVQSAARRGSAPEVLVSSAAQLLRKDGSSPAEEHQDCGEKGGQSLRIPTGDHIFGAIVPLESLDVPVGPEEPQGALVVPRPCPSAGGDSPIPPGAALETPKKEELNIEERIPVYLRNLGIEQSPGTILAPFVARGPLRELEFSPWGLRSLQPPLHTASPAGVPPQAQGALLPAFEMSQASFGSDVSPLSVSLSVGSEAGSEQDQELLSPRELFGEPPASQGSVPGSQLGEAAPGGTEGCPGRAGAEQDLPSCSLGSGPRAGGRRARGALADPESRSSGSSQQDWALGALSGLGDELELDRASSSSGVGSESSQGQERESLMGPGALQELRELLAQAEGLAASWSHPVCPTASCREPGEAPPVLGRREEDPKDARLSQDWIPKLPKRLPWDEAVTPRGVRGQGLDMHHLDSASCPLPWGHPLAVSSQRGEGLRPVAREPRAGKSAGRSEPEGSSSVGRSQAARAGLARSAASGHRGTGTAPQLGQPPPLEPPGRAPAALAGSLGSSWGRAAGTRGSEDSSSGDSLSARVRSLLGRAGHSRQPGSAPGAVQSLPGAVRSRTGAVWSLPEAAPSLPGAARSLPEAAPSLPGAARSLPEAARSLPGAARSLPGAARSRAGAVWSLPEAARSLPGATRSLPGAARSLPAAAWSPAGSGSSSGDSLAARVRGLLGTAGPGIPASRVLRSAEEHERRIRAWVKMKLASQSQECGADWDEEPQLRMEGIEAELLPKTREPSPAKDAWLCGLEAASEHLRKQEQDLEGVHAPRWPRDRHGQLSRTRELLQPSSPPAAPFSRADPWDSSLLRDMQLKPWGAADLQDVQLKPWGAADLQDVQLKSWGAADLQDVQLKAWNTAEPQDVHLKPCSAADLQDMQLKPCNDADLQDMQLKPCNAADLQDMQLKPWNTAEPQDVHLKPCSAAEPQDMHLKPCSAAEPQDMHLKPWNTAEPQDMHLKPWNTAEPQDMQLKPWNTAEPQDVHLKPCSAADLQDMHLKPCSAADLQDVQLKPWNTAEPQDIQLKPCNAAELQDVQLKPWNTAEPQDMHLKPWNTAEPQDMQLKPWNTAEPQDMHLKPCSAAEPQDMELKTCSAAELQDVQLKAWNTAEPQDMQLKPCSAADLQDVQLKPCSAADLQDVQLKPCSAADLQDVQLKPCSVAEPQDMQLKPCSAAEPQDVQLKPCSAAELQVPNQQPAVGHPSAMAELRAPLAQDPRAGSPAAAPAAHGELGKPSTSIAPCSQGLARSPSLASILPGEAAPARPGEQRLGTEPWHRAVTQGCPPCPTLAGTGVPPAPAARAAAAAPQETAQQPGSIHAGERQTLSARQPQVLPAAVAEGHRHSARELSQEMKPSIDSPPLSPSRQEQSPPGHTQLRESSQGPGAAALRGLLRGPSDVLAEGRKSPDEPPRVPEEAVREEMGPAHPLPADEAFSTTPEAPSAPVRRFLSCVHITLSSRVHHPSASSAGNGIKVWDKPPGKAQAVPFQAAPEASVEGVPKSLPAEGTPSSAEPVAPADPSRVLSPRQELLLQGRARAQLQGLGAGGAQGIPSSAPRAKPGKRTSDAATQITTESPRKATFSAEVCVDPREGGSAALQPSLPSAPEAPGIAAPPHQEIPPFPRQPGEQIPVYALEPAQAQPLLLPYKPSGSSAMYYVPFPKAGASVEPSTASSPSGSEDAPAPGVLARVRAGGDEPPPGRAAAQHRGTVRGHRPRLAWAEEHRTPLEQSSELPDGCQRVEPCRGVPEPRAVPAGQSGCQRPREPPGAGAGAAHAAPSSGAAPQGTAGQFFALPAEADDSRSEEPSARASLGPGAAGADPEPRGPAAHPQDGLGKALRQRGHARGSLQELWLRFLEHQGTQQQLRRNGELSLVERLDRLARLLQNPVRHTLAPAAAGESVPEQEMQGREQPEAGLAGKARSGSSTEPKEARVGRRPRVSHGSSSSPGELRAAGPGQKAIRHLSRILEEQQHLDIPSDSSSETRLSREPSSCSTCSTSAWDTGTGLDTSPASGDSSSLSLSLSTIDTARLLRAFGQHRLAPSTDTPSPAPELAPELSPRLARLYRAISQQKRRSEEWHEQSGAAGAGGCPQGAAQSLGKGQQSQSAVPFSDSTCASSSSWGPSCALSHKRRARMLNKGIQAGDLEIVSSATKRNTRDVGVTFPTPRSSQQLWEPPGQGQGTAWQQPRAQPGRLLTDTRTRRSRLHFQQGTPWLVPAEELECESRKENQCSASPGPGPAWFEPWSSTRPWREPLREKNWEEQPSLGQGAVTATGAGRGLGRPLGKLTLQEALALHRPDFISRSGQRLRHLRLLREERRLHTSQREPMLSAQREPMLPAQREPMLPAQREPMLPAQREQMLPPQQLLQPAGRRKDRRTANHLVSSRGFLMREKRRAIPKHEMFQRSKRMYEQLPEVRRKREEEQRKQEYSSYRLRAQLYKTKITSRVLGKKVSWS